MIEYIVYDKAKYHYDGNYPKDLPAEKAFVHTGMFLGWIIEKGLYSDEFAQEAEQIELFKQHKITGTKVYEWWDGALVDDMLNEEGNAFAQYYFDFQNGMYLNDYDELLASNLPSLYHVEDSWENYEKIKQRIDQRYKDWKANRSRKWWQFWSI